MYECNMKIKIWLLFVFYFICCYADLAAQVIENPVFDRTDTISFRVKKVELTKDTTYLYCLLSVESGSWANISEDTYLYDAKSGIKYPLLKSVGLPYSPQKRIFNNYDKCIITLCFPPIGKITKFDLIESQDDKAFNVYGVDLANSYKNSFQEVDIYRFRNMASFYDVAGDTLKAFFYQGQEIDAAKYVFGAKSETLSTSLIFASLMYEKYEKYEKAIEIEKQIGYIYADLKGKSEWYNALHLSTLARYYSKLENHLMSITTYEQCIKQFESIHIVDELYALSLRDMAIQYYEIGDETNAFFYQKKCLSVRRNLGDEKNYINELHALLITGPSSGRTRRIEIVLEELNNLPDFVDTSSVAISGIYKQIASMYSIMEKNRKAIDFCDKAIDILKNRNNEISNEYAELLGLKCKYHSHILESKEAIATGELAKQIFDTLRISSLKYAELLHDLAHVYGLTLNYERAIQLEKRACEIFGDASDWLSLAESYNNIGGYYRKIEMLDKAEQYTMEAIKILSNHGDAKQYIMDEVDITGNKYLNKPSTLASIKQRIDIDMSSFNSNLALIYQKQGRNIEAIETEWENSKNISEETHDKMNSAISLLNLSEFHFKNGCFSDAIGCAEESLNIINTEKTINNALFILQLAKICFQAGDSVKAIQFTIESLAAAEKFNDNESKQLTQSLLSFFYWKRHDFNKAEQYLAEGLDYLTKLICNELIGMTTEQKQRLWDKYEHNFLLYRSIIEKSDRNAFFLSKLYDYTLFSKSLLLDSEIQQRTKNISRLNIKWQDIQKHLSNNAIAIEFISTIEDEGGYNTYHALVIDKESPSPKMITLYSESRLEEIKKTEARNIRDIVGELIWKPILAQYATVRDIYFSPDGILYMLPIEYYSADGSINMSERYNMFRISSTKELVIKYESHDRKQAALYGGLDYSPFTIKSAENNTLKHNGNLRSISERGGFEPLYNTLKEINEIQTLMKTNNISTAVFSGNKGTETSFKDLSHREVNMIHLATHGMYVAPSNVKVKKQSDNFQFLELLSNDKNPVKEDIELTHSFLVMSGGNRLAQRDSSQYGIEDGILTAKEISQLDLEGLDLVVLSACETALGDVENGGVYGLQRGFKKAGANTILMSLDKVDDEATRILMVEFYRNLMNGKTKHQSLKDAQKHLRGVENGKYNAPKYWASFIMLDGLN